MGLIARLKKKGVVGINLRNADFLNIYNKRSLYPQVDEKLITKKLAIKAGVPVPELYAHIEFTAQVKRLVKDLSARSDFVIKPNRGSGGEGILVISGKVQESFRKINGKLISPDLLSHHLCNIISGMYSLGGHPDQALVEYRVSFDPLFEKVSFQGVPDIRIITFLGIPVMSMVRLPTQYSDGKANLHQGAVGAGIDMKSGETLNAVCRNKVVLRHPDTGCEISGIQIPRWSELLIFASRCYELTGIAYQGVDLVLDHQRGPLLLEINARPGLNIQIANSCGLLPRLRTVESRHHTLLTPEERVCFAQENFGVN